MTQQPNGFPCVLAGIAIRAKKRAAMQPLPRALVSVEKGVMALGDDGGLSSADFRGKPGKRQVTVLSAESWQQACGELGAELEWLARRANLLITGVEFSAEDVGKVIAIGSARLLITRETDPCERMDEACPGLKTALAPNWRGGVCCRVLAAGEINIGDEVVVITS